jgi:hypothetical protein
MQSAVGPSTVLRTVPLPTGYAGREELIVPAPTRGP